MASTYSNLKIQLMATGENSTTWGAVTNVNLGTAIEEAITGSVDVTFASANVTLTLTNSNATQSARNLRLNCTGTTGGARNLILGSGCQIEKVYIVNNGCADTITIKNTTGNGIAVPAGKTMYVFNNGTDVVDAITHLSSLTLGSPLAVADGGTGSTTATFSGANISNLNGSNVTSGTISNARTTASSSNGANTLVARGASGEFSAGVITADGSGLTALNASNVSTGTLAVTRGGTGTATLTANNVIIGNGTSAVNFVAPGTSGNVLTSNGSAWASTAIPTAFTAGMIMLWSGTIATIPSGWVLCNGANGTPDLRDRFVVGAGSTYAVTSTGGSADAIVVSHTHTASSSVSDPGHNHTYTQTTYNGAQNSGQTNALGSTTGTTSTSTTGISVSTTVNSSGSSGTNANLPPYYALAYIMKT